MSSSKEVSKEIHETLEISSKGLTKIFGSKKNPFTAVNQINLHVEPGIHGFLGPNGAGKTTTINMLIGALSITKGEAKIHGLPVGSIAAKQLIGFLPQDPQFYNEMTGEDYLIYLGKLGGLSSIEARRKAQELMKYFDIFEFRNREIGKYSGGMKQKIGIAAALIHDPKILLLDEPTANLDPIGRANIIEKIKELSGKISVFISSHILAEIEEMCTNVTMINHGEIVIADTIKNIKQKYIGNTLVLHTSKNEELLTVLQNDPDVQRVWIDDEEENHAIKILPKTDILNLQRKIPEILVKNEAILFYFKQPEMSLQDVFMTIMDDRPKNDHPKLEGK